MSVKLSKYLLDLGSLGKSSQLNTVNCVEKMPKKSQTKKTSFLFASCSMSEILHNIYNNYVHKCFGCSFQDHLYLFFN